ncbi:MAG: hypothetical protein V3W04_06510, partial [Gammaproteobacteria bacterium]
LYRFKKYSVMALDSKTRADKNGYRKVQPNELAEAIHDILPTLQHLQVTFSNDTWSKNVQ